MCVAAKVLIHVYLNPEPAHFSKNTLSLYKCPRYLILSSICFRNISPECTCQVDANFPPPSNITYLAILSAVDSFNTLFKAKPMSYFSLYCYHPSNLAFAVLWVNYKCVIKENEQKIALFTFLKVNSHQKAWPTLHSFLNVIWRINDLFFPLSLPPFNPE